MIKGCITSIFVTGYIMDVVGRKRTMILMSSVPFVAGWVMLLLPVPLSMADGPTIAMLLGGRYLTGELCSKRLVLGCVNRGIQTKGKPLIWL